MSQSPPGPADAYYPRPIELNGLRRGSPQLRDLGEGVEVVVIAEGDKLHVLREVCPHMGGPLSQATLRPARCHMRRPCPSRT